MTNGNHTSGPQPGGNRVGGILIALLGLLLLGYAFSAPSSPVPGTDVAALAASLAATGEPAYPDGFSGVPIERLSLGQRVLGQNPELGDAERAGFAEIVPADCRAIYLEMVKPSGDTLHVELIRPLAWFEAAIHSGLARDGCVWLDLPELGAVGEARVLRVEPCPAILPGDGMPITGRFIHQSSSTLLNLQVDGAPEDAPEAAPIGVTANHPFWSVDREAFVPAGELHVGEHLQTLHGPTTVASIWSGGLALGEVRGERQPTSRDWKRATARPRIAAMCRKQ